MYMPFRVSVLRSERITPNFQRVTFTGVDQMGPARVTRDLRIKIIIPGLKGLPDLPAGPEGIQVRRALPEDERGIMRTYSVRDFRRPEDPNQASQNRAELDIDFVLHTDEHGQSGPASRWAEEAKPGDELLVIAPSIDDDSGAGIEFSPGDCKTVQLYGDETALPAIAKTLSEWPEGTTGEAFIEVPTEADKQSVDAPDGVRIHWLVRESENADHGDLLISALEAAASAAQSGSEPGDQPQLDASSDDASAMVWETPQFSRNGEDLAPVEDAEADDVYYWIAGESGAVTAMRRLLVQGRGVPRQCVSFMGYWKKGVAHKG